VSPRAIISTPERIVAIAFNSAFDIRAHSLELDMNYADKGSV
jgi:hypothetical protein